MNTPLRLIIAAGAILCLSSAILAGDPPPAKRGVAVVDGKEVEAPKIPMGDAATIEKIITEGKDHSHVMEHLHHLTVEGGPRLTGSTRVEAANNWCKEQYESWGLSNAHIEDWGTIATRFDRGPSTLKLTLKRTRTRDDGETEIESTPLKDLEFTTAAWTRGTDGVKAGPVVKMPQTEEEYKALKDGDKLKGAWILIKSQPPAGRRGVQDRMSSNFQSRIDARKKVSASRDELVRTSAAPGWRDRKAEDVPPDVSVVVRRSDYDAINSRLADGDKIELEANLQQTLTPGPFRVYNTIAEIRGSTLPDEVVIISAHLDSWDGPGSQGCTDNGTGSSTTLEAARILATVMKNGGVPPKRTIRFIDWTGEEQGLLGSKGYVEKHKEEIIAHVSACIVDDGGTDYDGGLPAATQMVQYLAAATAPVNNVFWSETDKKYMNVNVRDTGTKIDVHGSSDHASFNKVGVPGFFWDEVGRADYSFGWHTQNDKFELGIEEYLRQSATAAAVTAYNLACAPELLPRAAMPEPKKPADTKPEEAPKKAGEQKAEMAGSRTGS
jgi:carboxypeptidase Q